MTSINTNVAALAALRTLTATSQSLGETQARIESGFKVNSAKDGPSTFVIAQGLRGDIQSLKAVQEGIGFGQAALTTASAAAEEVSNRLTDLREQFTNAQNEGLPTAPLQEEATAIINQIDAIVTSSTFSGINLLDGQKDLNVLSGINGETVQVASTDVSASGLNLNGLNLRTTDSLTRVNFGATFAVADTNTLELQRADGTSVTFEFDSGGGVTTGNIAVAIAAGDENATLNNLVTAINNVDGLESSIQASDVQGGTAGSIDIQDGLGPITAVTPTGLTAVTSTALTFATDVGFNGADAIQNNGAQFEITKSDGTTVRFEIEDTNVGDGVATGFTNVDADFSAVGFDTNGLIETLNTALAAEGLEAVRVEGDATAGDFTLRFRETGGGQIQDIQISNLATNTSSDPIRQRDSNNEIASSYADAQINNAVATLDTVLSSLGTAQNRLEGQASFTTLLTDKLTEGVGILVDADLAEESARLQALQTKQQLATQSLSIANQNPQTILSLFR